MEIFKDIENYSGYEVSTLGRVRNKITGVFLKPYFNSRGYFYVSLSQQGLVKKFSVHLLVTRAFLENTENKRYVDHINQVKTDNRLENLRYATNSENMMNRGAQSNNKSTGIKGITVDKKAFCAHICKDGKTITKNFKNLDDAVEWRRQKELELFGDFAPN